MNPGIRVLTKQAIRRAAQSVSPFLLDRFLSYRARRHVARFQEDAGLDRIQETFVATFGSMVLSGPFKGMHYAGRSAGSMALPKSIGCYESELHLAVESAIRRLPEVVIDVGAAEGYYAVGLARRLEIAHVFAFDSDSVAQRLCRETARLNNVESRVTVKGQCDPKALNFLLSCKGCLVISDCEGYEIELLDPAIAPKLSFAEIIVELHDHLRAGATNLLVHRFERTHTIEIVESVHRDTAEFSFLSVLTEADRAKAINEYRHVAPKWAVMLPR